MTDKRFEIITTTDGNVCIQDKNNGYVYHLTKNLVKLLNELYEENIELKKRLMIEQDKAIGLMK